MASSITAATMARPHIVNRMQDGQLAFRKSQDSVVRKNLAAAWMKEILENVKIPDEPTDEEFCFYLRNGFLLCKLINEIKPGAVPKIVGNSVPVGLDQQPVSAYQYFENMENFIAVARGLNVPTFELSDLRQENLSNSAAKLVDCILGLKSYHERKFKDRPSLVPVVHKNDRTHQNSSPGTDLLPALFFSANESKDSQLHYSALRTSVEEDNLDQKENTDQNIFHSRKNPELKLQTEGIISGFINAEKSMEKAFEDGIDVSRSAEEDCNSLPKEAHHLKGSKIRKEQLEELTSNVTELKSELEILREKQVALEKDLFNQFQPIIEEHMLEYKEKCQNYAQENKQLLNELLDLKGKIRVLCRVRPCKKDAENVIGIERDNSLLLNANEKNQPQKQFRFNTVFGPSATQEDVYKETQPLMRSVMDGYNVCIFAYGQTGSGKTHTMSGPDNAGENEVGLNHRALRDLFQISESRKAFMTYSISVQMIEIYNETIRDLLSVDISSKKLDIHSVTSKGFSVPEAKLEPVECSADVLELMERGQTNRAVSSTALNDRSSRSHSILMVHVKGQDLRTGSTICSCLNLIDLAGSERIQNSQVQGNRLKESISINKSLSALGDVIVALSQKNVHVPYRNSKLTQLLQHSLGGQAKVLMFVHIGPELDIYSETLSTLLFGEKVSNVELGAAQSNKESGEILRLKEQIENLKRSLSRKDEELAIKDTELVKKDSEITKLQAARFQHRISNKAMDRSPIRTSDYSESFTENSVSASESTLNSDFPKAGKLRDRNHGNMGFQKTTDNKMSKPTTSRIKPGKPPVAGSKTSEEKDYKKREGSSEKQPNTIVKGRASLGPLHSAGRTSMGPSRRKFSVGTSEQKLSAAASRRHGEAITATPVKENRRNSLHMNRLNVPATPVKENRRNSLHMNRLNVPATPVKENRRNSLHMNRLNVPATRGYQQGQRSYHSVGRKINPEKK